MSSENQSKSTSVSELLTEWKSFHTEQNVPTDNPLNSVIDHILTEAGMSDIVHNPDHTINATYNGIRYLGIYPTSLGHSEPRIEPLDDKLVVSVSFDHRTYK